MADKKAKIVISAKDLATKVFKGLTRALFSLKGLIVGGLGFTVLKKAMAATVGVAASADRAFVKLATSMKAAGRYTQESAESFRDLSVTLERQTGFVEEDILQALSILQTFGRMTRDDMEQTIVAALNMATIMNEDVTQSAIRLGKAYVGQVWALQRVGVSISKARFETEGFSAVLKQLALEQGGQAKARMAGFAGLLNKVKVEAGELGKETGRLVSRNKFFSTVVGGVVGVLQGLKNMVVAVRGVQDDSIKTAKDYAKALVYGDKAAASLSDTLKNKLAVELNRQLALTQDQLAARRDSITALTGEQKVIGIASQGYAELNALYKESGRLLDLLFKLRGDGVKAAGDTTKIEEFELIKQHNLVWDNLRKRAGMIKIGQARFKDLEERKTEIAEEEEEKRSDMAEIKANFRTNLAKQHAAQDAATNQAFVDVQIASIEEIGTIEQMELSKRSTARLAFLKEQINIIKTLMQGEKDRADEAIKKEIEQRDNSFERAESDEAENKLLEDALSIKQKLAEADKLSAQELKNIISETKRLEGFLSSVSDTTKEELLDAIKQVREETSKAISGKDVVAMELEIKTLKAEASFKEFANTASESLIKTIQNGLNNATFNMNVTANVTDRAGNKLGGE